MPGDTGDAAEPAAAPAEILVGGAADPLAQVFAERPESDLTPDVDADAGDSADAVEQAADSPG